MLTIWEKFKELHDLELKVETEKKALEEELDKIENIYWKAENIKQQLEIKRQVLIAHRNSIVDLMDCMAEEQRKEVEQILLDHYNSR